MKRKLKYFAIFLAIVFGFAGFAGIMAKKNSQSTTVHAATTTTTVTWTQDDIVSDNLVNDDTFSKDGVTLTSELLNLEYKFIGDGTFSTTLGNFTKIEVTGSNGIEGTGWSGDEMGIIWTEEPASSVSFSGAINGYNGVTIVFTIESAEEQQSQKTITFRPVVVDTREYATTERVYVNQIPEEVVVNYYVTYNDGVNAFVLVPSYDKDVFTLLDIENNPRVAVNGIDASAITVTGNVKGENDPEFVKIAFDSSTLYDAAHEYSAGSNENVLLLTLTFSVHTAPEGWGHYRGFFGLVLDDNGKTNNTSSVAYQDLSGHNLGNQQEVLINLDVDNPNEVAVPENVVDIYRRHDATITTAAESVTCTYRKEPMTVTKVGEFNPNLEYGVEYQYNGNGTPVVTWKDSNNNVLESAPQNAGTYTVTISVPATDTYSAPEPKTITVTINPAQVVVNITNQSKVYGENAITFAGNFGVKVPSGYYTVSGSVYGNDNITFNLTSGVVRTSNVDSYPISKTNVSISDGNDGNNYGLTIFDGTYTVTKYTIRIYYGDGQTTFNGGNKDAYSLSGLTLNIKDKDDFELPEDMATLLGTVTVTPSANFPETGVVPANNLENEDENDDYYKVTPLYAFVKESSATNFEVKTFQSYYRINQAQVRLVADDKLATFNGGTKADYVAPETYYVYAGSTTNPVSEALRTALGTVTLTVDFPAEDVVNARTYTITPHYTANNNLIVTPVNGAYTISPLALTTDEENAIKAAFGIVEVTYDAEEHTMYTFDASGLPLGLATNSSGYSVSATINGVEAEKKTDAGTYPVSITFTITDETINQNRNTTEQQYITIPVIVRNSNNEASKINPLPITIEAGSTSATFNGGTKTAYTDPTEYTINYTAQEGTISLKELASLGTVSLSVNFPTSGMVNATTYTITPVYTENGNYVVTPLNGTYTITKATPVLEIGAMSTYYNSHLYIYWPTITVGNLVLNVNGSTHNNAYGFEYAIEIWKGNQKVLNDAWISENYWLDAGTDYTAKLVLTGNDNYYSASASSNTFEIMKVYVSGPETITYNGNTVTWSEVTKDVDGKDLHNSTVTYTISGTEYENRSFTATAKGTYTLYVTPSNTNYEAIDFDFEPVYSVKFLGGTHTANPATPTNMPAEQLLFEDQYVTQPATNPSLTGYTFAGWNCDSWEFDFNLHNIHDEMVDGNGDCYLTAQWNILYYTVTFKYTEDGEAHNFSLPYNSTIAYAGLNLTPVKSSTDVGISYTYNGEWVSNNVTYTVNNDGNLKSNTDVYHVTGEATFVAQYTTNYISFTITYYVKENGGNYVEQEYKTEVAYGSEIEYRELETDVTWFKAKAWFANETRTEAAPVTMPNHNIEVYGAIVFDIGTGDVNGDGYVNANDITLYRQWIVGGYSMTFVEAGTEWATATSNNFDANGNYYLARVADNNADTSKDIRDVSITRMSIVGGYTWSIRTGLNVTGQEIKRDGRVTSFDGLSEALTSDERVTLLSDVTASNGILNLNLNQNVYINLNGKTLTVQKLTLNVTGDNTITIENGTIVTTEGVALTAPNGSVVLTSVTAYDKEGVIQLQAANHSLHFNGVVNFYKGVDTTAANPTPAAVKVEKGTHIVVEEEASVVVEKLVVTDQFVATVAADATITISNNSSVSTEIAVVGNYVNEIDTLNKLIEAGKNGGNYTLAANIETNGNKPIKFVKDTVLDLNGYSITSTNDVALRVLSGATLTLNGNGFVNAQEACVMAFGGSNVVINGGTYTSYDNFVIGTNGSAGNGGNTITINGGVFNGNIQSAGYVACGIYVANSDTVTVNAGTFNIENGVGVLARAGFTTIAEDVEFNVTGNGETGKVGDSRVVVPAGDIIVVDLFASKYPGLSEGFTLVNNTSYAVTGDVICNVNDLSTAMQNGGYYVLMNDFIYSGSLGFAYDTTLYLNGHTLQSVNNITLYATNGAKLTINGDGEVKGQEACVMAFTGSKVEINGGTYTCYDNFVIGTNGSTGYGNNLITINGGVFNGYIQSAGYIACGVYVANNDTVVINAGTFNITNGVGVLARSGNSTIAECVVFNMLGDNTISGGVGDKSLNIQSGNEIVVDLTNPAYPGGTPTVENNTEYNVVNLEA